MDFRNHKRFVSFTLEGQHLAMKSLPGDDHGHCSEYDCWLGCIALCLLLALTVVPCTLAQQPSAIPTQGDVFSADSRAAFDAVAGPVHGLRKDAADGTGAPQIGLDPNYPPNLPAWYNAKALYPSAAAGFEPCVNLLIQATTLIKESGLLMKGLPQTLAKINSNTRKATQLIKAADKCIDGVKAPVPTLQGRVDQTGPGGSTDGSGQTNPGGPSGGDASSSGSPPYNNPQNKSQTPPDVSNTNPGGSGSSGPCPGYYSEKWCNTPGVTPPPGCCGNSPPVLRGGANTSNRYDPCSIDDRLTPQQRWEIYHSPAYQARCVNRGGYNPINNPNNNPSANNTPNPYPPNGGLPSRGQLPSTPESEPPPCVIPPPPDVRAALLRGAAELDRISTQVQASELAATNEFFRGLSDSVSNQLKFLAQRPGDPAQQILDGAIAYVNNDSLENDRQLKSAAAQSIRQMRENPAYFFGSIAPDLVQLAVCEGPGLKKAVDASRIARAQEAQRRIVTINRNAQNFIEETGRPRPSYGTSPKVPSGKPSIQNYFCGNRNCFPVMIAEIDTQLGRDLRGRPYVALDIPPGPGEILPTPPGQAIEVLRKRYGGRVSDPQWGVERALNQIWGIPTEMSIPEIAAEIERGGAGALGGVFYENPNRTGHVINVRNEGGQAYFYDQQNGLTNRDLAGSLAQSLRVWFYRAN